MIDVTSDITATAGASSTADLRVPRGHVVTLKTSVDGGAVGYRAVRNYSH